LKAIRRLDLELNELKWWANWANLQWSGSGAYLLSSEEMPEVFFNRGGLTDCGARTAVVNRLEKGLIALGRMPALTVFESCHQAIGTLSRKGYEIADRMTVMEAEDGVHSRGDSPARVRLSSSMEKWSKAYLSAFYGELDLLPVTRKIVDRVRGLDSVTLLEAEVDGTVAGVSALFRTERLLGAYCIGTVPRFRERGVAGALLNHTWSVASSEGRSLVLQVLESDGARRFYEKRGFRAVYAKAIMEKKGY